MIDVDAAHLREKLAASGVLIAVAFTRKGAPPSDALSRALSDAEQKLGANFAIAMRVDMDAAGSAALIAELRIHREPELLVWNARGERLVARTEGAMQAAEIVSLLEHAATR